MGLDTPQGMHLCFFCQHCCLGFIQTVSFCVFLASCCLFLLGTRVRFSAQGGSENGASNSGKNCFSERAPRNKQAQSLIVAVLNMPLSLQPNLLTMHTSISEWVKTGTQRWDAFQLAKLDQNLQTSSSQCLTHSAMILLSLHFHTTYLDHPIQFHG